MAVSEAIENYLETIYILSLRQNEVHAVDVCAYLSYSRPTVSIVLRQMRESGLVTVDDINHIHLTPEGEAAYRREHADIEALLQTLIGRIGEAQALSLAEQINGLTEALSGLLAPGASAKERTSP